MVGSQNSQIIAKFSKIWYTKIVSLVIILIGGMPNASYVEMKMSHLRFCAVFVRLWMWTLARLWNSFEIVEIKHIMMDIRPFDIRPIG